MIFQVGTYARIRISNFCFTSLNKIIEVNIGIFVDFFLMNDLFF